MNFIVDSSFFSANVCVKMFAPSLLIYYFNNIGVWLAFYYTCLLFSLTVVDMLLQHLIETTITLQTHFPSNLFIFFISQKYAAQVSLLAIVGYWLVVLAMFIELL